MRINPCHLGCLLLCLLSACAAGEPETTYEFSLPPLPYAYTALEEYISNRTMTFHHDKHHQAYVNNLNDALKPYPWLHGVSLEALNAMVGTGMLPEEIESAIRNNGGGHWNHSFFWRIMMEPTNATDGPSGELESAIVDTFGSLEGLKEEFNAKASTRFGSGWAWLIKTPTGALKVTSTPNQDNPLMPRSVVGEVGNPLLALDVWEHAYYLDYQNKRGDYIKNWWNLVNWAEAERIFLESYMPYSQ